VAVFFVLRFTASAGFALLPLGVFGMPTNRLRRSAASAALAALPLELAASAVPVALSPEVLEAAAHAAAAAQPSGVLEATPAAITTDCFPIKRCVITA
jgi:hypothetical protein